MSLQLNQDASPVTLGSDHSLSKPPRRVVHLGTDVSTKGGIASVLRVILVPGWTFLPQEHIVTHRDGSALLKIIVFMNAWMKLLHDLMQKRLAIYQIHISTGGSFVRKILLASTIRLFGRPVIFHVHGSDFREFTNRLGGSSRALVAFGLRRADRLIVLSPEWRDFFSALVPGLPVEIIANAVSVPEEVLENRWKQTDWQFVSVGRLGNRKGTFDLIRAFSGLPEEMNRCSLHLAGDGEVEKARDFALSLKISDRVKIYGWLDTDACEELVRTSQVFTLPSYAEGLPMALLEAMAQGLPVVTTAVGGMASVVRDGSTGFLVQPGHPEEIENAFTRMFRDPLRTECMGKKARETILKHYGVASFYLALSQIYEKY